MKKFPVILFILLSLYLITGFSRLLAQQWSDPIYLSAGTNPDLVIDPETGELHIVAIIESKGVLYLRTNRYGEKLDSVIVPNTAFEKGMLHFGPTIAVDSQKYPHIGFRRHIGITDRYSVYYTRKTETDWTQPLTIAEKVIRGFMVRMAIDGHDVVHFAHGSVDPNWPNITGPVHYYILADDAIQFEQHNIIQIRADERFELDVSPDGIVNLVTSDFHYPPNPPEGGPLFYWRSRSVGDSLEYVGDLRHDEVKTGAIGSSDIFIDPAGNTHVCYGVEQDESIANKVSVHYCRIKDGVKILDKRITKYGELQEGERMPVTFPSVAAGKNGQWVCVAYTTVIDGPLYCRFSDDGGNYWSSTYFIADGWDTAEGRNKHILRAYRDDFFVVYPTDHGIYLRYIKLTQNEFPVAVLNTPDPAPEGSTIVFDASASYDPDGKIVKYMWDFQNDGIQDHSTSTPFDNFTYSSAFSGHAKLTVYDNHGDHSSTTVPISIYILTNELPVAQLSVPASSAEGSLINFDASASFDSDGTIVKYYWDFQNDEICDDSTTVPTNSFVYVDDFSGEVKLTVVDNRGDSMSVIQPITILNVPPTADAGGPYTGDWYTSIRIQAEAFDPGVLDTLIYEWDTDEDGIFETVGQNAWTINYTQEDTHWVVLQVKDNDGGVGLDTALIVINNQPPVLSKIPDQSIKEGQRFDPIKLDDFVEDPDNPDSTISWSFSGLKNLSVSMDSDRIATISALNPLWTGQEKINFMAIDPGEKSASSTATLTVNSVNDPPIVTPIPGQTRYENQPFAKIKLDDYVTDQDDSISVLKWDYFENENFNIEIVDRIAAVAVADSEWAGIDTVGFIVADPKGLKDTALVTFTVIGINDPPRIIPIEDQIIHKDQEFSPIVLAEHVFDPDDSVHTITWSWAGNTRLNVKLSQDGLLHFYKPDSTWIGSETLIFWATDAEGLYDLCTAKFVVKAGVDVTEHNDKTLPEDFALYPNYPNPFNPHTWIAYDIAKQSHIKLSIYNQLGHEICTLVNEAQEPGSHRVLWDGRDHSGNRVSSGVYFYRIEADNFRQTMKMTLIF